jgi:hypothetical protein
MADLPSVLAAVAAAVSKSVLSPDEAASIAQLWNAHTRAYELCEIERRRIGAKDWRMKFMDRRLDRIATRWRRYKTGIMAVIIIRQRGENWRAVS